MGVGSRVAVIICAAGSSSRMNGVKKEYQKLKSESDLTVLGSSVCAFASVPFVENIMIAVPLNDEDCARKAIPSEYLAAQKPKIEFVAGGKTRQASVYNALNALASCKPGYVLIHDGARPWVNKKLIQEIVEAVKKHDAVIPLLPLTDTPKECEASLENNQAVFIKNHLKRTNTGAAQTPQAFKFPEILDAHKKAAKENTEFTDDAEIWSMFCGKVTAISGSPENKKITFLEDMV